MKYYMLIVIQGALMKFDKAFLVTKGLGWILLLSNPMQHVTVVFTPSTLSVLLRKTLHNLA